MFNFIKKKQIVSRAQDEILYEYVMEEMEADIKVKGLWAKAIAHSDGIEAKITSMYMKFRVQNIKDQFTAVEIAYDDMSRNALFDYIKGGFKDTEVEEIEQPQIIEQRKSKLTNSETEFLDQYDCNEKSINVEINKNEIRIRNRREYHIFNRITQKFTTNNIMESEDVKSSNSTEKLIVSEDFKDAKDEYLKDYYKRKNS